MLSTLKKILNLTGAYKKDLYTGVVYSLLQSLCAAADLFAVLYIAVSVQNLTAEIIRNAFLILLAGLVGKMFCRWQITKRVSGAGYDIFQNVRLEVGEKLKTAPMGYFGEKQVGEIQAAATTGINDLENSAMPVLENILGSILYSFLSTIILFLFDWRIGLIAIVAQLIGCIFLYMVQKNAKKEVHLRFQAQKKMTGRIMEFVQGMAVTRLFGMETDGEGQVQEVFAEKRKADLAIENAAMWPVSLYRYTFKVAGCFIVLIASLLCVKGSMSFPFMVMFLFSAFLVFNQIDGVAASLAMLRAADLALDQMDTILNIPKMSGNKTADTIKNCNIDLEHVSFSYEEREIIHDVSIHIPEKSVTAIVGPSGGGKTTLCNLIARFWDVERGKVLIGGQDVKEIDSDELMTKMSFVFQNVYLFRDTIENNIRFGNPDATPEEIIAAAKKARCHEFIMAMPQGYQTMVGEGGCTLSGGEKQRISIARAILKDAPIVILDEATSSVDPENQHALVAAIQELTKEKTLITIAHRLSTIQNADLILVIDEGRISQAGTHEELAAQEGVYSRFMQIRKAAASWSLA